MKRRIAILIAVATFVSLVAAALADTTTIHDPAGDSIGGDAFDIRRATADHANGRLEHVVVVEDADTFTKRETFIFIRAGGNGYVVSKDGVRQGTAHVGSADVFRDGDRIVFRFRKSAIGSPGQYLWQAVTAAPDEKPFDLAPDHGKVLHDL